MPFAHHTGPVSRLFEHLGNSHCIPGKSPAVARQVVVKCHPSYTGLMLVKTGKQGCSGRAAAAGIVEMGKTKSFGSETVKVRRLDFPSIASEIRISQIIGKDDYNVRAFVFMRSRCCRGSGCQQRQRQKDLFRFHQIIGY